MTAVILALVGSCSAQSTMLRIAGHAKLPRSITSITISDNIAYVAHGLSHSSRRLSVLDISSPTAPVELGAVDLAGRAEAVAISGRYAYVVDERTGLLVIDPSVPARPAIVAAERSPVTGTCLSVVGGRAYVGDAVGLEVIDVSEPTDPTAVRSYDTQGFALAVASSNDHLYLADDEDGLRIIDVSVPTDPVLVDLFATPESTGVAVSGSFAYLVDLSHLRVIDVSEPARPVEVGFADTPGAAAGVAVAGGFAYVADGWAGLRAFDVSTPATPRPVGSLEIQGRARSVAVAGDYAYVGDENNRLMVVDISRPASPVAVGSVAADGFAYDLVADAGRVYMAAGRAGLRSFDSSGCSTAPRPVEPRRPRDRK